MKSYNNIEYYISFKTRKSKELLYPEMEQDIINLVFEICNSQAVNPTLIKIINQNLVELEVSTINDKLSPHIFITNLKLFLATELKKKYPHVTTKGPGLWTREHLVQSLGDKNLAKIKIFLEDSNN